MEVNENFEYACSECNSIVNENDIVCPRCGANFSEKQATERRTEMRQKSISQNKFCTNCGSAINEDDKYCNKCGQILTIIRMRETTKFQEDENNFFNKYKPGIILFSVLTFFMLLFPPIEWGTRYSNTFHVKKTGFYFLLSFSNTGRDWRMGINEAHINILQLFVQIILVAILSIIFQYYNVQIKKWWKSNF